jgi:hypothetical protein
MCQECRKREAAARAASEAELRYRKDPKYKALMIAKKKKEKRKKKKVDRKTKLNLWCLVLGYKDIRNYIYRLIGDEEIIVVIESMRTTFEPIIRKQLILEQRRKRIKSEKRKKKKELKRINH